METTVDRLAHQFERIVGSQLSRPVRHAASTSSIAEVTSLAIDMTERQRSPVSPRIRTASQVFALNAVPSATTSSETWRMPFMFKCLGTLRLERLHCRNFILITVHYLTRAMLIGANFNQRAPHIQRTAHSPSNYSLHLTTSNFPSIPLKLKRMLRRHEFKLDRQQIGIVLFSGVIRNQYLL